MKFFFTIALGLTVFGFTAFAQRNVAPAVDPVLEADAKHNLDVARQAFSKLKQAYKQVIYRFEETYAAQLLPLGRQRQAAGRSQIRSR